MVTKLFIPDKSYIGKGKTTFTITGSPVHELLYEDGIIKMKDIFSKFTTKENLRQTKDVSQLKFELHQILIFTKPSLQQLLTYTDSLNDGNFSKGSSIDCHGGTVSVNLMKISQKIFLMLCTNTRGIDDGKIRTPFG